MSALAFAAIDIVRVFLFLFGRDEFISSVKARKVELFQVAGQAANARACRVHARFEYEVSGMEYVGQSMTPYDDMPTSDGVLYKNHGELLSKAKRGRDIMVSYKASNPAESYLILEGAREAASRTLLIGVASLALLLVLGLRGFSVIEVWVPSIGLVGVAYPLAMHRLHGQTEMEPVQLP